MKKLSQLAVRRPVTFIMLALIVIGFGLYGLSQLRLNLYPDVNFPTITVYTTYDGVAPDDMETLITRPIEEQIGTISGLNRVRSQSSQGASVVKLYFDWGTDLFEAENDVRRQLDGVRRGLPDEADSPLVFSYDPNQEPVVVLTLTSDQRSPRELRTLSTQQLEQRIERISGIASATTAGGLDREINIALRNDQLRAYNVDIASIASRLSEENVQVPAGDLTEGRVVYSLRTMGNFENVEQIRNTVVARHDNQPVTLGDVARVEDGVEQPIGNVHVDGEDGLIINLQRQSDANVVTAAGSVMDRLDELRATLPDDVQLEVLTNRADFVNQSLQNLYFTGFQAVFLVMVILLLFLGSTRSSLVVGVSIPVSIISTFSIMHFADVSLNVISLSGLTLAVGLVVDNAVVVLENIFRFREEGKDGPTASVSGANEVVGPVVVSMLTTMVVFLPVLFVPGIAGFLFRDLALTISFALVMSALVAITLVPLLSSKLFAAEMAASSGSRLDRAISRVSGFRSASLFKRILGLPIMLLLLVLKALTLPFSWLRSRVGPKFRRLGVQLQYGFRKLDNAYRRLLTALVDRSAWVILGALVLLGATLPIYQQLGGEFFPRADESSFALQVEREPGVNLFELQRSIHHVEQIIQNEVPEARLIVSDYGDKRGVEGAENPGGNHGVVRVELVPIGDRDRSEQQIVSSLLDALHDVPGAQITELRENPLNPEGEEGLVVQVIGHDPDMRRDLTQGIQEEFQDMRGFASVTSSDDRGRPEIQVVMNRERIARNGLSTNQVANVIRNNIQGNEATSFVDRGIEYNVRVQLAAEERTSSQILENIQIQNDEGQWMPLGNLVRIERGRGPSNILRLDQERMSEIQIDLADIDLQQATGQARAFLDNLNWPEGYRYQIGGTAEEQQESFFFLVIAFVIAGILAYMVMASQFESLVEPFIIIVTIPLALSGVLVMLWLTQTPISVTAMVGLILLSGIVVNNGIVMIDFIKILQTRGQERKQAVINGAARRLRPILMTAATTILAMVPLALELGTGAETWSPMARTVIGGLTMSTLLMLLVVPCMYFLINGLIERLGFEAVNKMDPLSQTEGEHS